MVGITRRFLELLSASGLILGLVMGAVWAEGVLSPIETADEARGWNGVGRLILGDGGICTAVLVGPAQALTAAHCLYDQKSAARLPDDGIIFQAGWRSGRAAIYRGLSRAVIHPDYVYLAGDSAHIGSDIALLELEQEIRLPQISPFSTGGGATKGTKVSVASYAEGRMDSLSIERDCTILAQGPVQILSCDIGPGSSGAPVFSMAEGYAEIISIITAKVEYDGKEAALAVMAAEPLARLREELSRTRPRATGVRILTGGNKRGGAKFIRREVVAGG